MITTHKRKNICIYGGHYGSEGKGAWAEFILNRLEHKDQYVGVSESTPNSGHTCKLGKLRNLPICAFYLKQVVLGPDALIDPKVLKSDLETVRAINPCLELGIHANAGLVQEHHKELERDTVVKSISSTGSGSGAARSDKFIRRLPDSIISMNAEFSTAMNGVGYHVLSQEDYMDTIEQCHVFFECNQGLLLDPNFGIFPYCTSRTTLPDAALARNGLDVSTFVKHAVYRTYPIRTGGPSGPTGGKEVSFDDIGKPDEIATVTKRTRRIFEFCPHDFEMSIRLGRPHNIIFTHLDYLPPSMQSPALIPNWLMSYLTEEVYDRTVSGLHGYGSNGVGNFKFIGTL